MTHDLHPDSELEHFPGFLIRRMHQIAVARFAAETEAHNITPVQWAALRTVSTHPGIDQSALAREIALDTSTVAGVVDRLEARELLVRKPSPTDRRLRTLYVTEQGLQLARQVTERAIHVQQWLLSPLSAQERDQLQRCLSKVVEHHS